MPPLPPSPPSPRLPRRSLLTLLAGGAAAAGLPAPPAAAMTSNPADEGPLLPDRQALARAPAAPGARLLVDEGGRVGAWVWRGGDQRAAVAADPHQGLTVAHATIPPSTGAWRREWDGVHGHAEWFGARADDPAFDNQQPLQAAIDLVPTLLLGAGSYHLRGGIGITRNGTRIIGAGLTQTDQGTNDRGTQIVCSSATDTIIRIGAASERQPATLTETVQLIDLTVRRSAAPFVPQTGVEGAIGIALRWCVNCHIERVFSIDSTRGWHLYGTVENYLRHCGALRAISGNHGGSGDVFVGFHLDYRAPLAGGNAGNASLYIDHCRAFGGFGGRAPDCRYSAGLRTDGGWVDLYIHGLETGTLHYGIHGNGDGAGEGLSFRTENLTISNCVLDPGYKAAIQLENADASSAVQIVANYCAVTPSGTAIALANLGGAVTLTGNQCINGSPGGTGLSAVAVANLRTNGNIYTRLKEPIYLERVTNFAVADTIRVFDKAPDYPAVTVAACRRGQIDCIVSGRSGVQAAGVALKNGSSRIEINATNIDPAALIGGAATKLTLDGRPVTATGAFGDACLATGIMS